MGGEKGFSQSMNVCSHSRTPFGKGRAARAVEWSESGSADPKCNRGSLEVRPLIPYVPGCYTVVSAPGRHRCREIEPHAVLLWRRHPAAVLSKQMTALGAAES